jgi:hypothetical protein
LKSASALAHLFETECLHYVYGKATAVAFNQCIRQHLSHNNSNNPGTTGSGPPIPVSEQKEHVRMKHLTVFLFLMLMFAAALAQADCRHKGKDYPVGTVIDGLACTKDGWRKL